jgi:hypothetical protein
MFTLASSTENFFTHGSGSMILQPANVWYVALQDELFYCLVGVVLLMGWIEVQSPLHLFPTNFELKSDETFGGLFDYHSMLEGYNCSVF